MPVLRQAGVLSIRLTCPRPARTFGRSRRQALGAATLHGRRRANGRSRGRTWPRTSWTGGSAQNRTFLRARIRPDPPARADASAGGEGGSPSQARARSESHGGPGGRAPLKPGYPRPPTPLAPASAPDLPATCPYARQAALLDAFGPDPSPSKKGEGHLLADVSAEARTEPNGMRVRA